jgi:hypothetical protein
MTKQELRGLRGLKCPKHGVVDEIVIESIMSIGEDGKLEHHGQVLLCPECESD